MSGLRDRLRRLTKSEESVVSPDTAAVDSAELTETYASVEWARIGAEIVSFRGGAFVRRTRRYESSHTHGRYRIGELRKVTQELAALGSMERALDDPSRLLFFDTETTGLGVGTGNVPFMIGYGFLDGESFVVEQLFMRNPAEEYYALSYLCTLLERFAHLVTYNGRSFDWPVLKNRYVLQRLDLPADPAHIDFLYPARSLWKASLPSCKLSTVEEKKLGYWRGTDLPGSEAPVRYVQYLRSQRVEDVEDVFIHNERDILSLAVLAVCFHELLTGSATVVPGIIPEDGVRLATWLDRLDKRERAQEELTEFLRSGKAARGQLLEAAALWKRWHGYDEAAALWRMYCNQSAGTFHAIEPLIELAIYYEHRARDIDKALIWAMKARTLVERRLSLGKRRDSDRELLRQIDHRVIRLRRKIDKPRQEMLQFH